MKLLRTIRLDPSDTFVFERAAEPGEWAVPGGFAFATMDVARLDGKKRAAFRSGFLGIDSLGWSTLVQVVEASEEDRAAAVVLLAQRLAERFGAPSLDAAKAAAEEEIGFAASISNHPKGMLVALARKHDNGDIRETFRTLAPGIGARPARAFAIIDVAGEDDEGPAEEIDLVALRQKGGLMSEARDFWISCGHHLLDRDADGMLLITDEFLKAYLARPEIAPPPEACAAERALHGALLADPRRPVRRQEVATIADADARENWEAMVAFRDQLASHPTLEAAYLDIVRRNLRFPHLFLSQLVHVILRNILDGCDDAFVLRAAELFFRPQKLTLHEGSLVAADEETVSGIGQRPLSPLVSMLGLPAAAEIDVLNEDNAGSYWERSDRFDMALDLTAGRYGLAALGEVARRWVGHLLAVAVKIEPLIELQDAPLVWYVGLDAEGTRIGDAMWNGEELDEAELSRVVSLYRLTFEDANDVEDRVRGEPVYLIGAMAADKVLRIKPQNLITGLPIRRLEVVN